MEQKSPNFFVTKAQEFFQPFEPTERELVQQIIDRSGLLYENVAAIINRYARQETTFNRVRLAMLLSEEHNRLNPRKSPTPAWKTAKEIDDREATEFVEQLDAQERDRYSNEVRVKFSTLYQRRDPTKTR